MQWDWERFIYVQLLIMIVFVLCLGWLFGACHGKCGKFPAQFVASPSAPLPPESTVMSPDNSVFDSAVKLALFFLLFGLL